MAVVVTIAKGYDLGYIWKTQDLSAERTIGGYYLDAAQAGEPPGRWWGPGAQALGRTPGQIVHRQPYDAVYRQTDPRTGARLGRARGRYPTFADHLARLQAAEPHATAERLIELEREAARATRQPAAYYCCPSLKCPMKAAFRAPMWGCVKAPAAVVAAGPWWWGCRWLWVRCRCQVSVYSVTAARAACCSSTMTLPAAKVATRAWMARLLTARG